MPEESKLYGVAAEFETPEGLCAAATALHDRNFGVVDTYSPLPISGMDTALGMRSPILGWVAMASVLGLGGLCYGIMSFATVADYPFLIGGRPLWSWPYFVIPSIAFGTGFGAVALFAAMLFLDRLPRLNHPIFNVDGIQSATQDRLFVAVEARSEDFNPDVVEQFLADLPIRPLRIQRVPR